MTMTPVSGTSASGRVEPRRVSSPRKELHPAAYLVFGFGLLAGIAFGVHALFGLLH